MIIVDTLGIIVAWLVVGFAVACLDARTGKIDTSWSSTTLVYTCILLWPLLAVALIGTATKSVPHSAAGHIVGYIVGWPARTLTAINRAANAGKPIPARKPNQDGVVVYKARDSIERKALESGGTHFASPDGSLCWCSKRHRYTQAYDTSHSVSA